MYYFVYWREVCMWKGAAVNSFHSAPSLQRRAQPWDVNWILQHCVYVSINHLSKSFFNLSEQRARSFARRADGESCFWKLIALLSVHFTQAYIYGENFSGINWIRAPYLVININSKLARLFSLYWFASIGNTRRTHGNVKILRFYFIKCFHFFFIEFEQREPTSN